MSKPLIAVLLSGCGVYDGSEIHEAVLTFYNIDKEGGEWQCIAPDINQHHVVNHLTGEETKEKRNVLTESARIARGNIKNLKNVSVADYAALVIPGGFGAAKNLSKWALSGPEGEINNEVKRIINEFVTAKKPIAAFCMGPTVVAKALEGTSYRAKLTVGTTDKSSQYDIKAINKGIQKLNGQPLPAEAEGVVIDDELLIVSTPCYMMDASIYEIGFGIQKAIKKLMKWVD